MGTLLQDLRYGVRALLKAPGFAAVALLSIALGIGANTAIFTLVDQILLRLLPVKDPKELVLLTWRGSHFGSNTGGNSLSYPMYKDFRDRNEVFTGTFCRFILPLSMGYQGRTERVQGELVSGNYFDVLGVGAAIGRVITTEDDKVPGAHPVAVLSYDYWVNRFAGDPKVLGQTLIVNAQPLTIIGVSQKGFDGVELGVSAKIRVPVMMKKQMTPGIWADVYSLDNRRGRWVQAFGRLKPGVTQQQAKASLQPLFHSILEMEVQEAAFAGATAYMKERFLASSIDVLPASQGRSFLRQRAEKPLWVLMAIVAGVLLIACANVANLLIARATARQKEIAVRLAIGAGRGRVIRQLMVESLLLAVLGGGLGLLLAVWTDRVLIAAIPAGEAPLNISAAPDLRIFAFALAVTLLTAVLFGLAPAFQASRVDLAPTLKEQAGALAVGGGVARARKALVVTQVFLSLVLLIGAGLFVRSLRNLALSNPGFRTQNVIAFSIDPGLNGYDKDKGQFFYRQLTEKLQAIPGVDSAALGLVRVLDGDEWDNSIAVEGYQAKQGENMNPFFNALSPGYFATLGIPLLEGRDFLPTDVSGRRKVAIVNEKWARYFFGDRSAIGHRMGFGGGPGAKTDIEIVGVIANAKYQNMREEIQRQNFVPYLQHWALGMTGYVRTRLDPKEMFSAIRRVVHEMDPNIPVVDMRTLDVQIERNLVTERLIAFLAAVFALLATLLAAIGLYGVMAYSVIRRTREIGIRMALGAGGRNVVWLVMREVLVLVTAGVVIALPTAWLLTRYVQSQLYGITPHDPGSIVVATVGLTVVAVLAGYLPALRATRIDPIQALRYE